MPAPRADFACLAPKCQQDGAATIYELPVTATRCPVCGSKRVRRLYNAVQIGSSTARAHDKILESSSIPAQMDAAKDKAVSNTIRGEALAAAGGSAQGALGVVQGFPGAALYSRGGTDQRGDRVLGSVDVIRSLTKPRPANG